VTISVPAAARASVVDTIVSGEVGYLAQRYGDASHRGAEPLVYHNAAHTTGCIDAVLRIGERLVGAGLLEAWDVHLLRVAAAFHDHEQGLEAGANESASADAAESAMRAHPGIFSERDIARVRGAVLATRVEFAGGKLVQMVDAQDRFSMVLADADLAHLGLPNAIQSSLQLNEEIQKRSGRRTLDRDLSITFLKFSAELMSYHKFHLRESRELFAAQQLANHRKLAALVDAYARGAITYGGLKKRALQFAQGAALS
jgi:predicted metal-dependent HD superfamily phosphohydrolase